MDRRSKRRGTTPGERAVVAVFSDPALAYSDQAPFDPPNPVYSAVCETLAELGLDRARYGGPEWNPLAELVAPGGRVVIKPNLVTSRNMHHELNTRELLCSSTHSSVLRPIVDLALRAVGDDGEVLIVDAPLEGSDFELTVESLGLDAMVRALRRQHGDRLKLLDLRSFSVRRHMWLDDVSLGGRSLNAGVLLRARMPGDPRGYRRIDLGGKSRFASHGAPAHRLRFHRSHKRTPAPHHRDGRHEYSVSGSVLDSDLLISVPKLKTHKKAGVTLSLKSAIGLSNEKYWLPHYTAGAPPGGDEYPRTPPLGQRIESQLARLPLPFGASLILRAARREQRTLGLSEGSWAGNDTIWRVVHDLNHILLCADASGVLHERPVRSHLALIDGIVAGEGDGPLAATPVDAGVLVAGEVPHAVDTIGCRIMGFDPDSIPTLSEVRKVDASLLADYDGIDVRSVRGPLPSLRFAPPMGWPEPMRQVG